MFNLFLDFLLLFDRKYQKTLSFLREQKVFLDAGDIDGAVRNGTRFLEEDRVNG